MYKKILLAYDGSLEGRAALREGAMLVLHTDAQVYLLSVVSEAPGVMLAEGAYAGAVSGARHTYQSVLDEGAERLRALGFDPVAKLVTGDPPAAIGAYAKQIGADLVVVGHRRKSFLERWWSGSVDVNLLDYISCSLLVSRNMVSDEAFETAMTRKVAQGAA